LEALTLAMRQMRYNKNVKQDVVEESLLKLFVLQTELKDFAGALNTFEKIKGTDLSGEVIGMLEESVADMEALRFDDQTYAVDARIPQDPYSWFFHLHKSDFLIKNVAGEIAELKLRCDRDYVFWRFQENLAYSVSEDQGTCSMEVLGDPGTTFTLVQM